MSEPTTEAGRKMLVDQGTAKQREVLAIEAEARAAGFREAEARREAQAAGDQASEIDPDALAVAIDEAQNPSLNPGRRWSRIGGVEDAARDIANAYNRIVAATLAPAPVQPAAAPSNAEIDRMARLLMAEWERVEGPLVGTSYVATFADLARVALARQPAAAPRETAALNLLRYLWSAELPFAAAWAAQRAVGDVMTVRDVYVHGTAGDPLLSDIDDLLRSATPAAASAELASE